MSTNVRMNKFIIVEGLDGSGKTTIIDYLESLYEADRLPIVRTRSVGGVEGGIGNAFRAKFVDQSKKPLPMLELLGMITSIYETYTEVVIPNIVTSDVVIDRFIPSFMAYQGGGRDVSTLTTSLVNHLLNNDEYIVRPKDGNPGIPHVLPNILIYCKVSAETSNKRASTTKHNSYFDQELSDFKHKVLDEYDYIVQQSSEWIPVVYTIDCEQPLADVLDAVAQIYYTNINPVTIGDVPGLYEVLDDVSKTEITNDKLKGN